MHIEIEKSEDKLFISLLKEQNILKVIQCCLFFVRIQYKSQMKGSESRQITFSHRHEINDFQKISFEPYAFENTYLRFSSSTIHMTKIDNQDESRQVIIQNAQIVEDISRVISNVQGTQCIIKKTFPQQEKIFLLIYVGQIYYICEIAAKSVTIQLNTIFNWIIRIADGSLFEKIMEKAVISYKFLVEQEKVTIMMLVKNQEKDAFNLYKWHNEGQLLVFEDDLLRSRQIISENNFNNVYFSLKCIIFINKHGKIRTHNILNTSKSGSQYTDSDDLLRIVQNYTRLHNQMKGSITQTLISSCQSQCSFYFLFSTSKNDKLLLVRWIKDNNFVEIKNYSNYQFVNYFRNASEIYITCLKQLKDKSVLLIWQQGHYYLLQLFSLMDSKIRLLQADSPHLKFGIHNNLLLMYDINLYFSVQFQQDQRSKFMIFLTSSKQSQRIQSRQQTSISEKQAIIAKSQEQSKKASTEVVSSTNRQQNKTQNQNFSLFEQKSSSNCPIIDFKGNNKLSQSNVVQPQQCVSEQQAQQKQKLQKTNQFVKKYQTPPASKQGQTFGPSPTFKMNESHRSKQPNPMQILASRIQFNLNGQLPSFNPSQMNNRQQFVSFGVPPQKNINIQTDMQIPTTLNRNFSFGNNNQKQREVKQPIVKAEPKRNLKILSRLSEEVKRHEIAMNFQVNNIRDIQNQSKQFQLEYVFLQHFKQIKQSLLKQKAFFIPQHKSFQTLMAEIQQLKRQFQTKFQTITNDINRKIHQYDLSQKLKSRKKFSKQESVQKNGETIKKKIIKLKFKIDKLRADSLSKIAKTQQKTTKL